MNIEILKDKVLAELTLQGFDLTINDKLLLTDLDKSTCKAVHQKAKVDQIRTHRDSIQKGYTKAKPYFLNGNDIEPEKIELELREVTANSLEEVIFKWWNFVWWSVPYQRPYGRQMRFLLWDKHHNAPFGLIGLQSPILKMNVRDKALKIQGEKLDYWINRSMQAQRLGALPPYNDLIGGKMVALAATSNELRKKYKEKYADNITILKKAKLETDLIFLTTTSAFGRSSIYNRLKYHNENVASSLGFTKGAGSFHISELLFRELISFLEFEGYSKTDTSFGSGPSRRIKLLSTAFRKLGLPNFSYHNIRRELFLFPLVSNLEQVISTSEMPNYIDRPLSDLVDFWKKRWAINRTINFENWNQFTINEFINKVQEDFCLQFI